MRDQPQNLGAPVDLRRILAPRALKLLQATTAHLAKTNRAALFGLLNFYREYVPHFAEITDPLRRLLGDDSKAWTEAVTVSVREVATLILNGVSWIAFDRDKELRVETRVTSVGMSAIMLQRDPNSPREWAPVAGWGRALA